MRKRQIEKLSVTAAMRWNFCRRAGEEQQIGVLGPRVLIWRASVQRWFAAQEHYAQGTLGTAAKSGPRTRV